MEITEHLRRIWLCFVNKIKSFQSLSKQPTQLMIAAKIRHIGCFSTTKSKWNSIKNCISFTGDLNLRILILFFIIHYNRCHHQNCHRRSVQGEMYQRHPLGWLQKYFQSFGARSPNFHWRWSDFRNCKRMWTWLCYWWNWK